MMYAGLDVHLKRTSICVLGSSGQVLEHRTIKKTYHSVIEEMKKVKEKYGDELSVCFEASGSSGYLHDRLGAFCERVVVAHPGHLRLIFRSKKKNDHVDAKKLATLLFLDQVPPAYVPSQGVRSWRAAIEYRTRLVNKRTRVKNELRSLLRSVGVSPPKKLWSLPGTDWLKGVELPDNLSRLRRDMLLEEYFSLKDKIKRVEWELNRVARSHPGVRLLKTIPGIGVRTAEAFVAYIDDPERFSSVHKIGSYLGLIPSQDASGSTNRLGRITRQGPGIVRRLLTEASWMAIRRSPTIRACFERATHGQPDRRKKAIIATAHYLARVCLAMLKNNEPWKEKKALTQKARASDEPELKAHSQRAPNRVA